MPVFSVHKAASRGFAVVPFNAFVLIRTSGTVAAPVDRGNIYVPAPCPVFSGFGDLIIRRFDIGEDCPFSMASSFILIKVAS